ncbi:MAG: gephyrin-like molybdotransferase Glp [Haloarculaceae archaeon]
MSDLRESGFKDVTRVADARERLLDAVEPIERTDHVSLSSADGRVLATAVEADRDVPHYRRAAMDGYAVRAEDTFGASSRSPAVLRAEGTDADAVDPETAVRVHTGSQVPEGADAVVMIEDVEEVGADLEVFDAVAEGENVAPAGEDVAAGQHLYDPGHRIRPSDTGLLKSVDVRALSVYQRPTVGVVPTGEELVQHDPGPGEVIETNGLTVSQFVERWGGKATYRDVVTDDYEALRAAIQRDLTKDVVVTTGGSSVGERDLMPEIVDDLGEILFHGVAVRPGHPFGAGVVDDTPVLMLPGYPVACIVNAVQFLRPLVKYLGHVPETGHPTTTARLDGKIRSEPGMRTFARVALEREARSASEASGETASDGEATRASKASGDAVARPTRTSGAGVLSSVALADGWVVVPEDREGIPDGETVTVEEWEAHL